MNIFADENIPQQIVTQLRAEGHQVEYVVQQVEDRIILENAYKQKALLITSDKDFGRLVLDEGKPTAGVLLLRVSRAIPIRDRARILVDVLRHRQNELQGAFTTLTEAIIDIRRPPPSFPDNITSE
jgi:predicted nuclease of predicted toxin-antitoxin system